MVSTANDSIRRRTGRWAIIGLLSLIIMMNTGLAGLIPLSGQWSGAAKGMCKSCIQCANMEGEEQKACLMECLRAGVGYLLGPLCVLIVLDHGLPVEAWS